MLILRMGDASLHDDGLIEAGEWHSVQALVRAWDLLEQERAHQAADARARCRQARARAIRRGHRAGMALSARRHVALSAALARASIRLQRELSALVDQRIDALLSAHGPAQWLQPELACCLAVASPQPVVSIRVCAEQLSLAHAWIAEAWTSREASGQLPPGPLRTGMPQVIADASLSRTCCVVETATGVVRGRLTSQLAAVRDGLRDAANRRLDSLLAQWKALP